MVIERVTREVRDPIRQKVLTGIPIVTLVFGLVAASFAAYSTGKFFSASSLSSDIEPFYQRVDGAGCHLIAKSQAFELSGVWHIYHELTNVGDKGCIVNWPNILDHKTVAPGQEEMASSLVDKRPSRAKSVLSFNADGQQPIQEEIDALPGRNK